MEPNNSDSMLAGIRKAFPGVVTVRRATSDELGRTRRRFVCQGGCPECERIAWKGSGSGGEDASKWCRSLRRSASKPMPAWGRGAYQEAWGAFQSWRLSASDPVAFTGTYSDAYGGSHGLWDADRVERDVREALSGLPLQGDALFCVEHHPSGRHILHVHGVLSGCCGDLLADRWRCRGFHRLRVLNGSDAALRYVCKHAAKQDRALLFVVTGNTFRSLRERRNHRRSMRSAKGRQTA